MEKLTETVDHVASRTTIAAFSGLFIGASLGVYRGSPIPRACFSTAGSCALAGTACFASERIIHALLLGTVGSDNNDSSSNLTDNNNSSSTGNNNLRMVSHVFGGMIGGAVNGSLFQKRPIAGMGLFVPIMVMVALGEDKLNDARRSRIEYLLRQNDENKG